MLFLASIEAWIELEKAKLVPPLIVDGYNSSGILSQVKADVVKQLSYETTNGHLGFYSWIACNASSTDGAVSTCDRDTPPAPAARWPKLEAGQSLIDSQDLFPQALAVTLDVGGSKTRLRLQEMIAAGRYNRLVRNNLVPQENIDPRIVSSADKWNPIDAKGFCKPSPNGSMVYAGHCVCSNETSIAGSTCWGNFGNNQQNGGRIFSTMATVFESGLYQDAFADFKANVINLRSITKQLNAMDYRRPLLSSDRSYLRKPTGSLARAMCIEMHHGPASVALKDGWGDDLCDYYKDLTFGLRTGPRGMLLGFAVGALQLKVSASGKLSVFGSELSPHTSEVVRKQINLPPWVRAQWPKELAGLQIGGINVGAQRGVVLSCNASEALELVDCTATFPRSARNMVEYEPRHAILA